MMLLFCPDAPNALRTGRAERRDGRWPCGAKAPASATGAVKDVFKKRCKPRQLLNMVLPCNACETCSWADGASPQKGDCMASAAALRATSEKDKLAAPAKSKIALPAKSCALPTWWFWRGGCTRSHSEHGRETPQRRWYFVLRRGRVGRCQVCKTQDKQTNIFSHSTGARPDRHAATSDNR